MTWMEFNPRVIIIQRIFNEDAIALPSRFHGRTPNTEIP